MQFTLAEAIDPPGEHSQYQSQPDVAARSLTILLLAVKEVLPYTRGIVPQETGKTKPLRATV